MAQLERTATRGFPVTARHVARTILTALTALLCATTVIVLVGTDEFETPIFVVTVALGRCIARSGNARTDSEACKRACADFLQERPPTGSIRVLVVIFRHCVNAFIFIILNYNGFHNWQCSDAGRRLEVGISKVLAREVLILHPSAQRPCSDFEVIVAVTVVGAIVVFIGPMMEAVAGAVAVLMGASIQAVNVAVLSSPPIPRKIA